MGAHPRLKTARCASDNIETLYGAIEDGALAVRIPKHARKELEAYLDCGRIDRHLRRRGLVRIDDDVDDTGAEGDPESNLAASAVSGQAPPAGPQWVRGLQPLEPQGLAYDKPLCASLDGFPGAVVVESALV